MDADQPMHSATPRRLTSPLAAVLLAGAALLAGGCGDDSDAGVRIGMQDLQFEPREETVRVGQRVEWRNDEDAPHNVLAITGARFRSETLGRDDTFSFTPDRAGAIRYVCTLHPGMTGTLRVAG